MSFAFDAHRFAELTATIPAKRPIRPFYVRKLITFIEKVRENSYGD